VGLFLLFDAVGDIVITLVLGSTLGGVDSGAAAERNVDCFDEASGDR